MNDDKQLYLSELSKGMPDINKLDHISQELWWKNSLKK